MLRKVFSRNRTSKKDLDNIQLNDGVEINESDGLISQIKETEDKECDELSFIVDYIGSEYVSEAQSVPLLMETLKRIKKQHPKTIRVDLVLKSGIFKVTDIEQGALLITAPLYAIALCAQEQLRGFETTFALNITRRRIHMCHVFQAGSTLEAGSIVRSIAISFRSVAKDLKELRFDNTLTSERMCSDSEVSSYRYRSRTVSDTGKEFDLIAGRHFGQMGGLPVVQSDGKIETENIDNTNEILLHHSFNDSTGEGLMSSEDDHSDTKMFSGDESSQERFFIANLDELYTKALGAIQSHDKVTFFKCFDEGLPIDSTDSNHLSLLHHAVANNKPDFVELLLESGADVNKEGKKDQTPLHCAAGLGNRAITKILLAHGANVRAKDCQFRTPLHLCAGCLQSLEVSYVLVEHGARIEDNDIEGVRPVDLHLELREMQNRLIQSACDAFAAADLSRSRSNSGNSSAGSYKSIRSPSVTRRGHTGRLLRSGSLRLKASPSLQSIQDVGDCDADNPFQIHDSNVEAVRSLMLPPLNTCNEVSYKNSVYEEYDRSNNKMDDQCDQFNDHPVRHIRETVDSKILQSNKLNQHSSLSRLFKKDPATDSLHLLATLSGNAECQSTILANLCLPKPSSQLVNLAHSVNSVHLNLQQISKLLRNLFTVAGPTGRQKCVSTGLLKTVVDLLDASEPVQSTCLSILNDLLQTENEREYSGTMSGIPIEPLLTIIKSTDHDPGQIKEKTKLRVTKSIDSGYISSLVMDNGVKRKLDERDKKNPIFKSHSFGLASSKSQLKEKVEPVNVLPEGDRVRSESFESAENRTKQLLSGRINRKVSETDTIERKWRRCNESNGSFETPVGTLQGKSQRNTSVVARHVAMKMLTASSRNAKLQEQLAEPSVLKLLIECLDDSDEEIVLQATTTLANIAQNVETHSQLRAENILDGFFKLVKYNHLLIKYQAARGLIYLGHSIEDVYIFDFISEDESNQTVIYSTDEGRTHIKGDTIEHLIFILTTDPRLLWGDTHIIQLSGKKPHTKNSTTKIRGKIFPGESQIINFILTTFQTFVHPIIFMRLLLHRYFDPRIHKGFSEIDNKYPHMEHYAPLPVLHARIMRIWISWLENHPSHFVTRPELCEELSNVIPVMKQIDGPYTPCATKLECLLAKVGEKSDHGSSYHFEVNDHHNVLYEQCQRAIIEEQLPCPDDDFVYLAGLQFYIDDLKQYGHDFTNCRQLSDCLENINTSRLKTGNIMPSFTTKQYVKKIRQHYEAFFTKQPTERNAKHNYVDCCQGMEGYGCTFFKVKQRIPSARSRKVYTPRYVGISSKRVVILDERSKVCAEKFIFKDLRRWKPVEVNLTFTMSFGTKTGDKTIEFMLENRSSFKELSNQILTYTMEINFQSYHNVDTNPWSRLAEHYGTWGIMALQRLVDDRTKPNNAEQNHNTEKQQLPTAVDATASSTQDGIIPGHFQPNSTLFNQYDNLSRNSSNISAGIFFNLKNSFKNRGNIVLLPPPNPSEFGMMSPESNENSPADTLNEFCLSYQCNHDVESEPRCIISKRMSSASIRERTPMLDSNNERSSGDFLSAGMQRQIITGKLLTCNCPPDADLPNLNLREFSAFELLHHPRELARQITLIDHELFCAINSTDVLLKIKFGLISKHNNIQSQLTVEKIAERFNKLSNWIVYCIVSERNIHRRATIFTNFIETAKQCLEMRNYNAVMSIVMASLGSVHVRRLAVTKELVSPDYLNCLSKIENLMDSKSNYKKYRETLRTSPTPAVPYFGIFLKDFTFISDGNPDYLKGGVINLSKRRQVFMLLEEIHRFQRKRYNFQEVVEIKNYLLNKPLVSEEQLHQMSREHESNYAPKPTVQTQLTLI